MDKDCYPYGFIVPDLPVLELEPDQNALEEMLELGNTAEADVLPTLQPVKVESFVYNEQVFILENVMRESTTNSIVSHSVVTNEALTDSVEQGAGRAVVAKISAEQPEGSSLVIANEWEPASNIFQQMTEPGENAEAEQELSTSTATISEQPTCSTSGRVRKASEELVSSTEQNKSNKLRGKTGCGKRRAKKHVVPDELKDSEYWEKRQKNNRAARRSRRAKRLSESRNRLTELIDENERLMELVLSNRTAIEDFKRNVLSLGLEPKMI